MSTRKKTSVHAAVTVILIVLILFAAVGLAGLLISSRKPPAQALPQETSVNVEVVSAQPENVSVLIVGYGETRPIEVVPVTPQAPGNVMEIHERLFVGEIIPAGEVLFRVDPRDYEAALSQATAQVDQARSMLARLRTQYAADRERLNTLARSRDLARNEFDRLRQLFEEEAVGALANVERAEMAYNQARDGHDLLLQAVELYPSRINEAEQGLKAAEAGLALAEITLERTVVRAPFNARIKEKRVEAGQYVGPGAPVLVLANDSILELAVPLDSRDARSGLLFSPSSGSPAGSAWFPPVEPVACRIFWTEDDVGQGWDGTLDRVINFDERTRTVTLAVRVDAEEARANPSNLPLVEGMFCRVEIPGHTLEQVVRLPRECVTFNNRVYVAIEGRLHPREVTVARTQQEQAFISDGLEPGELVIITRLVDPLPGTKVVFDDADIPPSSALAPTRAESGQNGEQPESST